MFFSQSKSVFMAYDFDNFNQKDMENYQLKKETTKGDMIEK